MKDEIIKKWSSILDLESGSTKSNWFEEYSHWATHADIYGDMTPEEYNVAIQPTQPDPFSTIQFPMVRRIEARTLGGDYYYKSEKQQKKEDRINKLRKLEGKKPNVELPNDQYSPGLVSVQPLSAPIGKLLYADFKYEDTEEEKRKKKQKIRKEKLENLSGVKFIKYLQLNIIRKLKYIEEIIKLR